MNEKSAYFDNAATTFPKPEIVYQLADEFYRSCGANAGRGQYPMAAKAMKLIEETRELLLALFRCNNKQAIFTSSATEAINKILFGLNLEPGSIIYLSPFEHNAVTRVAYALEQNAGIKIKHLPFERNSLRLDERRIKQEFAESPPSVVIATHASNVCGTVLPIEMVFSLAKRHQAITLVDMSQTAGLLELPVASSIIDYAIFAGHKTLLAPFGVGGFFCNANANLTPIMFGGTGINSLDQGSAETLRERIEIGSPNIYAIAGLNASLKWIDKKGIAAIHQYESDNADQLLNILRSYSNITIVADSITTERIGVVSALFDNYSPDEIGSVLASNGVAVRTGLHCSPYAHAFLGTAPSGTVRFSVSCLTAEEDFGILRNALNVIRDHG